MSPRPLLPKVMEVCWPRKPGSRVTASPIMRPRDRLLVSQAASCYLTVARAWQQRTPTLTLPRSLPLDSARQMHPFPGASGPPWPPARR